jgi:hypothetical protein
LKKESWDMLTNHIHPELGTLISPALLALFHGPASSRRPPPLAACLLDYAFSRSNRWHPGPAPLVFCLDSAATRIHELFLCLVLSPTISVNQLTDWPLGRSYEKGFTLAAISEITYLESLSLRFLVHFLCSMLVSVLDLVLMLVFMNLTFVLMFVLMHDFVLMFMLMHDFVLMFMLMHRFRLLLVLMFFFHFLPPHVLADVQTIVEFIEIQARLTIQDIYSGYVSNTIS